MQAIRYLAEDVELPPTKKNTEYCVIVTHIVNPHHFYVRSIQFSKLIEYIENTMPLKDLPLVDAVFTKKTIIFNLNPDNELPKYARGEIVETGDSVCRVYALDYGYYKANVSYEFMWECHECLIDMEPLAISCQLANCFPKSVDWGTAIEAFKRLVGDGRTHMKIVDNTFTQLLVTLDNTCGTDIATSLAEARETLWGFVPHDQKITSNGTPPPNVSYEFKQLQLNVDIQVRVLSGRSLDGFYVAEINDYKEYMKEQENIDYYSTKAISVEKGSMKYGDSVLVWRGSCSYDRGFIKEVCSDDDNCYHVQMVDTGKDKIVNHANLKITPEQCVKMPAVAIYCYVKGKVSYDLNLLLHPGRQFVITVHKLGKQLYFEKPNLVTISHCDYL